MLISKIDNKYLLVGVVLAAGVFISVAIIAKAQTESGAQNAGAISGAAVIIFPVPELGNCKDKDGCKSYCDDPANISACVKFAEDHGLMNKDEAGKALKFGKKILEGGGPGGCKSPQECELFCGDVGNLDACLQFADEQGLSDDNIREGRKIRDYLKSGGQLPGGCASKDSCEAYCGDFDHLEECLVFAEKTGIGPASPPGQFGREEGPGIEQIQKIIELTKKGESPGGCKSKEQCDAYCKADDHFEECVTFAEKAGFMTPEQAILVRKTGSKGPGGCDSEDSCKYYCNDVSHREECFNFAEGHGLISPDQLNEMREGMLRLKQGLEQASPEAAACLKSTLGENIITNIQSGNLVPGPEIGDRVKSCFEKFGAPGAEKVFSDAPPEVLRGGVKNAMPSGSSAGGSGAVESMMIGASLPPQLLGCVKNKVGEDVINKLIRGTINGEEIDNTKEAIKSCNEESAKQNFPPQVLGCIRAKIGGDTYDKILKGEEDYAGISGVLQECMAPIVIPVEPLRDSVVTPSVPSVPEPSAISPGTNSVSPQY